MMKKQYQAVIKNIDKGTYVSNEERGEVFHAKDKNKALLFADEQDAEQTLEMLNDNYSDCYVLIQLN